MTRFAANSIAVFAAAFLTLASIGAVVTVPTANASPIAPMVA